MASVAGLYQKFIFPGYNLFVSLFSGIYQICIPAFPFDPPTQSGTFNNVTGQEGGEDFQGEKFHGWKYNMQKRFVSTMPCSTHATFNCIHTNIIFM